MMQAFETKRIFPFLIILVSILFSIPLSFAASSLTSKQESREIAIPVLKAAALPAQTNYETGWDSVKDQPAGAMSQMTDDGALNKRYDSETKTEISDLKMKRKIRLHPELDSGWIDPLQLKNGSRPEPKVQKIAAKKAVSAEEKFLDPKKESEKKIQQPLKKKENKSVPELPKPKKEIKKEVPKIQDKKIEPQVKKAEIKEKISVMPSPIKPVIQVPEPVKIKESGIFSALNFGEIHLQAATDLYEMKAETQRGGTFLKMNVMLKQETEGSNQFSYQVDLKEQTIQYLNPQSLKKFSQDLQADASQEGFESHLQNTERDIRAMKAQYQQFLNTAASDQDQNFDRILNVLQQMKESIQSFKKHPID